MLVLLSCVSSALFVLDLRSWVSESPGYCCCKLPIPHVHLHSASVGERDAVSTKG